MASTAQAISARTRARMSTPPYDHTTAPALVYNRPTRSDIDALLLGSAALTAKVRRDVVDALEGAGLLNGGKGACPNRRLRPTLKSRRLIAPSLDLRDRFRSGGEIHSVGRRCPWRSSTDHLRRPALKAAGHRTRRDQCLALRALALVAVPQQSGRSPFTRDVRNR